jgi:hypothetical protein
MEWLQIEKKCLYTNNYYRVVYIVMSTVGIVKGVQNYGSNKKE